MLVVNGVCTAPEARREIIRWSLIRSTRIYPVVVYSWILRSRIDIPTHHKWTNKVVTHIVDVHLRGFTRGSTLHSS